MAGLIFPPWILHEHDYCKIMGIENTRNTKFCTVLLLCLVWFFFFFFPGKLNGIVKITELLPKLRRNIRVLPKYRPTEVSKKISYSLQEILIFSVQWKVFWVTKPNIQSERNCLAFKFKVDFTFSVLLSHFTPLGISKWN